MMGSDMIAKERIAQLMREAEAERLAKPLVEARRRARRQRARTRISAIRTAVFAGRPRRAVRPVTGA